jgi:hypothetical protein
MGSRVVLAVITLVERERPAVEPGFGRVGGDCAQARDEPALQFTLL